ncbi:hypothetical protein QFZ99_007188 [Paraburkholderia atlantica]
MLGPDAGRQNRTLVVQRGNEAGIFRKTVDGANNEAAKLTVFRYAPGGEKPKSAQIPRETVVIRANVLDAGTC